MDAWVAAWMQSLQPGCIGLQCSSLGEGMRVRGACSSDAYTPPKAGSSRWLVHVDASSETCTLHERGSCRD